MQILNLLQWMKKMIKTIKEAAKHFGIELEAVTPKHIDFIKEQKTIKNYGNMGTPKRQYFVHENGVVEFTKPILNQAELSLSNN